MVIKLQIFMIKIPKVDCNYNCLAVTRYINNNLSDFSSTDYSDDFDKE